jgi:UDP-2-acetamido-2-deoxy-ribo-hexuluronate aminotransferase
VAPDDVSSQHLLTLSLPDHANRAAVRRILADAGIQTTVHYPPAHLQPAFARWARGPLPLTEALGRRNLTLPLHPFLDEAAIDLVTGTLARALVS